MTPDDRKDVAISALGACSPVGASALQTYASVRAGINRFAEHPAHNLVAVDPEWDAPEPLFCSRMGTVDPGLEGIERLVALGLPALHDLLAGTRLRRGDLPSTGLILTCAADEDLVPAAPAAEFLAALVRRAGLSGLARAETVQGGHCAVFQALTNAARSLDTGAVRQVIVGAVDSCLMEPRLGRLDRAWRIKSGRNVDGFIPGECAVFFLVERPGPGPSPRRPLAILTGSGSGRETNLVGGEKASTGAGLSQAITAALASETGDGPAAWAIADLNGESYRAFEWGLVVARLGDRLGALRRLSHPADAVGDTGAATGGVLLGLAIDAFRSARAPARSALLWTSSDDGSRSAICVRAAGDA